MERWAKRVDCQAASMVDMSEEHASLPSPCPKVGQPYFEGKGDFTLSQCFCFSFPHFVSVGRQQDLGATLSDPCTHKLSSPEDTACFLRAVQWVLEKAHWPLFQMLCVSDLPGSCSCSCLCTTSLDLLPAPWEDHAQL